MALYQIVIIAITAIIFSYFILNFIGKIIISKVLTSKNKLDDYLFKALLLPIKSLLWIIYIYLFIIILQDYYPYLLKIITYIDVVFIVFIVWIFIALINVAEKYLVIENNKFDKDIVRLFSRLVKIIVVSVGVLSILQFFGFAISSILTFGGVGGMIIGFAAKDMLGNIFGGLMISLDKPFSVGDWMRVGNIEGTVENIGWRMTKIRTFSKNPIYIPNGIFSTKEIETPSRMTNRRIREVIGVRYDDINVLPSIIISIEDMLKNHVDIDKNALTMVYFNHFGDSSLELIIYTFTKTTNWLEFQKIKGNILLKIAEIISSYNAEIAYPTQTLKINKQID